MNNNAINGSDGVVGAIVIGVAALISWLIRLFRKHNINKHTKKIVIMGTKGSGKTLLWTQLQGKSFSGSYEETISETIDEFTFTTKNGRRIKVVKTTDYGGGNDYVRFFKELLVDGTFVILLVDLTNLTNEAHGQIFGTLGMIQRTLNIKSKGSGLMILATHFNEFSCGYKTKDEAKYEVIKFLGAHKLKRYFNKQIKVVELRAQSDIETIKEEIANT